MVDLFYPLTRKDKPMVDLFRTITEKDQPQVYLCMGENFDPVSG
jgi:hypothetical protein